MMAVTSTGVSAGIGTTYCSSAMVLSAHVKQPGVVATLPSPSVRLTPSAMRVSWGSRGTHVTITRSPSWT